MTFTDDEQQEHRAAFIKECHQKSWGAACHADFIGKSLDDLTARYAKLQEEDDAIAASPDYHAVENREKRKQLAASMKLLKEHIAGGQKVMRDLLQSVDSNMMLAKHAEGWSWSVRGEDLQ